MFSDTVLRHKLSRNSSATSASSSYLSPGCRPFADHARDCNRDERVAIQWRHNERDGVSNHRRQDYLRNRFFKRRSKKASKLRVTGLCLGNSPVTGESPHNGPVVWKMFPFDDVIMGFYGMVSALELMARWYQKAKQMRHGK